MEVIIVLIGIGVLIFVWRQYFKQNKKSRNATKYYDKKLDKKIKKDFNNTK